MTDQPGRRAPGYVRAAGLLVLLAGVLVMHVLVVAPAHAHPAGHAAAQVITGRLTSRTASGHADMAMTAQHDSVPHRTPAARAMPGMPADPRAGCCTMRGGMHACVFIRTALALTLGLALLGRVGADRYDPPRPAPRWLTRRTRPPPWTMPSLAGLSILRI